MTNEKPPLALMILQEAFYGAYVWGTFGIFVGAVGMAFRHLVVGDVPSVLIAAVVGATLFGAVGAVFGVVQVLFVAITSKRPRPQPLLYTPAAVNSNPPANMTVFVVGDLHGCWEQADEEYYAIRKPDLLLWTGDLADNVLQSPAIAYSLAQLDSTYGILGNHDGAPTMLVVQEARNNRLAQLWLGVGHARRVRRLKRLLGNREVGFEIRDFSELGVSLVGMRPLSSGAGKPTSFSKTLQKVYGVEDSLAAIKLDIDTAEYDKLIMLGHNGPAGLGYEVDAPFGRDWRPEGGDVGDADYREAIEYAQQQGKQVVLAVGGHMHDVVNPRRGRDRRRVPLRFLDGVPVLNACRVPRIIHEDGKHWHYHYECQFGESGLLKVELVSWNSTDEEERRELVWEGG